MESRASEKKAEKFVQLKKTPVEDKTDPLNSALNAKLNTEVPVNHIPTSSAPISINNPIQNIRPKPKQNLEFDPEAVIWEAEKIKEEILSLNKRRQENEMLSDQYEQFIRGKLTMGLATHEFADLIHDYEKVIPAYKALCKSLVKANVMNEAEIEEIERSGKIKSQQFFPAFQFKYDKKAAELSGIKDEKINTTKASLLKSARDYSDRTDFYYAYHATTGILSLFLQPAVPFFMTGLVVHAIDKMITSVKHFVMNKKVRQAQDEYQNGIKALDKDINVDIQNSKPLTQFKQSFFKLAKEVQQNHLLELEEKHQQIPSGKMELR